MLQNEINNIDCDNAIWNYPAIKNRVKSKNSNIFIAWEHLYCDKHKINLTMRELNGNNSFLCLLEEEKLEISNHKVAELVEQIKQNYVKFCNEIFDFN